ncbi:MAG: ABC transporter permease [Bacteroidales bacterium]|nr:ABC transporter permease [Bacteroidales bacterium]MCF8458265.1 ABC transporter permease [Bacteroidales bacterium]
MMKRYLHDINIAIEAILANKLKSILTALGIIFGVAAVISMLAIGNGAQQEILDQMKMVGVNNIVISPIVEKPSEDQGEEESQQKKKFSRGLTLADAEGIAELIPTVNKISPHIFIDSYILLSGKRKDAKLEAVTNHFFQLFDYQLEEGKYFNDYQEEHGLPVCVIGSEVKSRFFESSNPIGQYLKCGNEWLRVVGVLEKRNITTSGIGKVDAGNSNEKIYLPIKTMLMRYKNRALITTKKLRGEMYEGDGWSTYTSAQGMGANYNQLDKIIVQVKETEQLTPTTEVLERFLLRRHSGLPDFEITVPELLLKQQQRTKDIFNIVLGAIASISLIVGGIGIMNIMLASVMERIREIGTRQAIGATRKDIVVQFLSESILICLVGGIIGVILGFLFSELITRFADIKTIVSPFSVLIAFGVSAGIGVLFGYMPAKRASERDPVESLRYE